jgi:hypothetical protein
MEQFCTSAVSTPQHCGTCGNTCPGIGATADNVGCQNAMTCVFSCQGENYDVDLDPSNGCEVADAPTGNHTQSAAASQGNVSDCDGGNNNEFSFNGMLPSDERVHNPGITGFDPNTGSAPDWTSVYGVGHTFCQNDLVVWLQVSNTNNPTCYHFHAVTDKYTYDCDADGTGSCSFQNNGGGQFSDNTTIYFAVWKTCGLNVTEAATYNIHGHL